jgi:hypothetical protein
VTFAVPTVYEKLCSGEPEAKVRVLGATGAFMEEVESHRRKQCNAMVAANLASKALAELANDRSTIIALANHQFETLGDIMSHFAMQLKSQVDQDQMSGSRKLLEYSYPEDFDEQGQQAQRKAQWLEAVADHKFAHTLSSRSLSEAKGNLCLVNSAAGSSSSGVPRETVFVLADSLFRRGNYGGKLAEKTH